MTQHIEILDGGMGRELARVGAPFRQPEWSALALYEAPKQVRAVHDSFVEAGAGTLTTNSYAVVPFHIGAARFAADGERLAALAGQLARQAADAAAHPVRVAGSLPPAAGSYRPDLFVAEQAIAIHRVLVLLRHLTLTSGWVKPSAPLLKPWRSIRRLPISRSRCGCRSACTMTRTSRKLPARCAQARA